MAVRSGRFVNGRRRPALLLLLLLLAVFLLGSLLALHKLNHSPLIHQYDILQEYLESNPPKGSRTRSILLWSSFFGDSRWGLPADSLGPQELREELHCPVYQCEVTNSHDFLPNLDMYDAIVFHVAESFPFLRPVPSRRSPHQAYVFALMESAGETKHRLSDEGGFYNLTMTNRLDSDVVWPYGQLQDIETGAVVAPSAQVHWRQQPTKGEGNDTSASRLWRGKTKMAAWFVSHCKTLSRRENLTAALQEHIEVDVYGKCGPLSCTRGDSHCDEMLDTDYMFYLAFENSLCEDYVTEKLYGVLERHIIPVVFGGADYTRFLPPHSYIDANRFDSALELAEHMRFVANDMEEYTSYFWWREHYRMVNVSPFCDLCARLHSSAQRHRSQVYGDIESWWFNSCRLKTNIQF
ncbi:alpha-(1,3)-fucosyltransferase C [Drosophila guanche]|uniref:Fucosyltransferase n=1 Tax=Drosophila guanche TaxID=7266 RepID=A0A3B0J9L2_DROGU|nr:alpha-(1,3)-fucosyltransferase C [Drosophila guanche]SPP78615.1 blast:Alpha-(1%2C3)-fucosyltransferase C [Drosophila guanche]